MTDADATPVGEGWTRHNQELLVHAPSQVFFAQRGEHRGKYLVHGDGKEWTVCPAPHVGADTPIEVRSAAASVVRPLAPGTASTGTRSSDADRKLERAVVIAEMPKTARLALRFPLGFLDSPAACYGLFSGLRNNVGAAHWCASQFHQRLLPEIAKRIHGWWDSEAEMPEELLYRGSHVGSLSKLLREHLENMDRDLLAGLHGFGGCEVVIAVLIGESMVCAAAGQAGASLLFDDSEPIALLPAPGDDGDETEKTDGESGGGPANSLKRGLATADGCLLGQDRLVRRAKYVWDAGAAISAEPEDAVGRILRAPDLFAVLGLPEGSPKDVSELRGAYKRLALRVHPDKVRDCDPLDAKTAFARVESAAKTLELLLEHNAKACRELHRMLRCDAFTLRGAAALLKVEMDADEKQVNRAFEDAKKSVAEAHIRETDAEVRLVLASLCGAAETIRIARIGCAPGSAGERLMAEGVAIESLGALGLRDLRGLRLGSRVTEGAIGLVVRTASWRVGEALRVALCAGATAELHISDLVGPARLCRWQPKAAAIQWAKSALELPNRHADNSASAICICIRDRIDEDGADNADDYGRPTKKQKVERGPKSVRVRHLLLRCAEPGRPLPDDPSARRLKGSLKRVGGGGASVSAAPVVVRTPAEAEAQLIELLRELLPLSSEPQVEADVQKRLLAFRKLCQIHSECETADNAGQLCGDIGWISRGQGELAFEQAAFSLRVGDISDVTTTSRGVHLIQRLA